jgi:hypothetical protein
LNGGDCRCGNGGISRQVGAVANRDR